MPGLVTQSWRHIVFTLNQHRFQGWADDDPPVDFPNIEIIDYTLGRDGTLFASDMGVRGGPVTVKLLSNSESAGRCMTWFTEALNDKELDFSGIYTDQRLNVSLRMVDGKMTACDTVIVPGKTFEATWVFQQLIPAADAAKGLSTPPPVTAT